MTSQFFLNQSAFHLTLFPIYSCILEFILTSYSLYFYIDRYAGWTWYHQIYKYGWFNLHRKNTNIWWSISLYFRASTNTYILRYPWYRMILDRQSYDIECLVGSTSRLGHLPLMMCIIIEEIRREKKWCFLKMLLIMIISFTRKRLFNPFCTLHIFIRLCMLISISLAYFYLYKWCLQNKVQIGVIRIYKDMKYEIDSLTSFSLHPIILMDMW